MNSISISLMVVAVLASVSATDYCSRTLCDSQVNHIACGHSGNFDSSCPSNAALVTMTSSLKEYLVNAHNEKRNFIAGGNDANHRPACRMATMQWDDELASLAGLNVRQCKIAHDECHNTDTFKFSGQNIAWMGYFGAANDSARLAQTFQMWYDEVGNSKQSFIDAFPSGYSGPTIGHFTVMMADRNIRMGCAAATYSPTGASYNAYLVACNYATTNMVNFPIYASCNKAASGCTSGTNPSYPNLCSTSENYDVNKWF